MPAEYHVDDIRRLRRGIGALANASDDLIEDLYHEYSDEVCASWLIVTDAGVRHFENWLDDNARERLRA